MDPVSGAPPSLARMGCHLADLVYRDQPVGGCTLAHGIEQFIEPEPPIRQSVFL
jgi:hypothetical protein